MFFPFISKRHRHLVLTHWQKEYLNIAGPGLWVLLLLLFLFTIKNGFLPLFYNASYLQLEQPILPGLHAAMLITLGFEFSLSLLAGAGVGGMGHVVKRLNQSSSVSVHSAVSRPFSKPFLFCLGRTKFLQLDLEAGWLGNNPPLWEVVLPTLRDFVRDIDPHFHVKMHMLLAPHNCSEPPRKRRGLKLACGFLALGNCSGCPESTMFRQANCFWGQGGESSCLLTVNTSHVPGHKGGRCKSTDSSDCWNRNTSSNWQGFTQKSACFFLSLDDTDTDNNMLFCFGNLRFFLFVSQINQWAKSVCENEQKGREKGRKTAM